MRHFLITDIEHSSQLWHEAPGVMGEVIRQHDRLVSAVIQRYGGQTHRHTGDGLLVSFPLHTDVLSCALEIQAQASAYAWPLPDVRLRVAVHSGSTHVLALPTREQFTWQTEDLTGPHITLTELLVSHTRGGYVTFTEAVLRHCALPEGAEAVPLQLVTFTDFPPLQVYGLKHPRLPGTTQQALRTILPTFALPRHETIFLGREMELSRLHVLLKRPTVRLISIVGPSGIGKSRLAGEIARAVANDFPEGVLFIDLETASRPHDLYQAIAHHWKLSPQPAHLSPEAIFQALRERSLLLILDACAREVFAHPVAQLLEHTERPRLLVTAIRPLELPGEEVIPLHGLAFASSDVQVAEVGHYTATRLFVAHARKHQPAFQPTTHDLEAIRRICQLVEGYPLAIELAASWVGTLDCATIAREIESNPALLQADDADRPPHQTSLMAAFDHTWQHLSPTERETLLKVAVFRGAFTSRDAQQVCQTNDAQLRTLQQRGLLRHSSSRRYQMPAIFHQLIRYKWQQPAAQPCIASLGQRHTHYFLNILANTQDDLEGHKQQEAIQHLQDIWPDIRHAYLEGVAASPDTDLLLQATHAMNIFLNYSGWYTAGSDIFTQACERHAPRLRQNLAHQRLHACLLLLRIWFTYVINEDAQLVERHLTGIQAALALLDEEDSLASLLACNLAGYLYWRMERPAEAIPLLERARAMARRLQHPWHEAFALTYLGNAFWDRHEVDKALEAYHLALVIREDLGEVIGQGITLNNLGFALKEQEAFERALDCLHAALDIAREHHLGWLAALALVNLSEIAIRQGRYGQAIQWLREVLAIRRQAGQQLVAGVALQMLGITHYYQGNFEAAAANLHHAEIIFRQYQQSVFLGNTYIHQGILAWVEGNPALARTRLLQGQAIANAWGQTLAEVYLTHLDLLDGQLAQARARLPQLAAQTGQHSDLKEDILLAALAVYSHLVPDRESQGAMLTTFTRQQPVKAHLAHTARFWMQRLGIQPTPYPTPISNPDALLQDILTRLP